MNKEIMTTKRNITLDATKGLLIFLVVLGHSLQYGFGSEYYENREFYNDYLFRGIYTFHMPLFMFLSGFFFCKSNQRQLSSVLKSKLLYIGIPFITYYSLWYFAWWYSSGLDVFYLSDFIRKMQINVWFLSSLLLNCVVVACVSHTLKPRLTFLILTLMVLLTFMVSDKWIPAMHKYLFVFFVMGYYYRKVPFRLNSYVQKKFVFSVLTVMLLLSLFIYDRELMIYKGGYSVIYGGHINWLQLGKDVLRFSIGIVSSCWFMGMVYLIRTRVHLISPLFVELGKVTLGIYGMQTVLFYVILHSMKAANFSIDHN